MSITRRCNTSKDKPATTLRSAKEVGKLLSIRNIRYKHRNGLWRRKLVLGLKPDTIIFQSLRHKRWTVQNFHWARLAATTEVVQLNCLGVEPKPVRTVYAGSLVSAPTCDRAKIIGQVLVLSAKGSLSIGTRSPLVGSRHSREGLGSSFRDDQTCWKKEKTIRSCGDGAVLDRNGIYQPAYPNQRIKGVFLKHGMTQLVKTS